MLKTALDRMSKTLFVNTWECQLLRGGYWRASQAWRHNDAIPYPTHKRVCETRRTAGRSRPRAPGSAARSTVQHFIQTYWEAPLESGRFFHGPLSGILFVLLIIPLLSGCGLIFIADIKERTRCGSESAPGSPELLPHLPFRQVFLLPVGVSPHRRWQAGRPSP